MTAFRDLSFADPAMLTGEVFTGSIGDRDPDGFDKQSGMTDPRLYASEFESLAKDAVPYVGQLGFLIEHFAAGEVTVRLPYSDLLVRPGGTICGPALMALADITLYGVVMSLLGRVELAVTTDLTFHFLARPAQADVVAEGRILKLGRRLAIGEVHLHSTGSGTLVCHAIGSYAIPPSVD